MPLAPELVGERMVHLGPRAYGPVPQLVGVVGVDLQDRRGAADRERREHAGVGELAAEVHPRLADLDLDRHHAAVRKRHALHLARPERLLVEPAGGGCVRDDDVRAHAGHGQAARSAVSVVRAAAVPLTRS
jgi:hypothetical protein